MCLEDSYPSYLVSGPVYSLRPVGGYCLSEKGSAYYGTRINSSCYAPLGDSKVDIDRDEEARVSA